MLIIIDSIVLNSCTSVFGRTIEANAATLMDRVGRWTLCACQGTSEFLGGEALDGLLSKVPMKVVINCSL